MRTNFQNRDIIFRHEDGCLVRITASDDGRSYTHRCELNVYEAVAYAMDETPAQGGGTTQTLIAQQEDLPFTQVNVAMEFLKERGLIDVRHRRSYPATAAVHMDAMVEWYALAEKPVVT